ncbi:MAG: hypothetical protein ABJ360_22460 [Roseobacter sp.]
MNELSQIARPLVPEEVDRMTDSWRGLLHSQIQTTGQAEEIRAAVAKLSTPATKQWIAGRAATLLSQYFTSSIPAEMMTAIAEDWHEELKSYPSWALQKAVRWWMSADNDKRRQKPIAGDISDRAKEEMGIVKVAEGALRRFDGKTNWPPASPTFENRQPRSAAQKAEADQITARFTARFGSMHERGE